MNIPLCYFPGTSTLSLSSENIVELVSLDPPALPVPPGPASRSAADPLSRARGYPSTVAGTNMATPTMSITVAIALDSAALSAKNRLPPSGSSR